MPSIHSSLNIHAVFSTKERRPLIDESFREDLFGYLGGIVQNQNAIPLEMILDASGVPYDPEYLW